MTRAVDRVYAHLRDGIVAGSYEPGSRLGEVEIAELTATSRTPVREALRRLEMEGLVEVLPHRGARVRSWTADDLDEIYDLRMNLEAMAASRAARRIEDKDVDRLDELCDLMEAAAAQGAEQRLDLMAQLAGFTRESRWADWDRSVFTADSRSHVTVCRLPGGTS